MTTPDSMSKGKSVTTGYNEPVVKDLGAGLPRNATVGYAEDQTNKGKSAAVPAVSMATSDELGHTIAATTPHGSTGVGAVVNTLTTISGRTTVLPRLDATKKESWVIEARPRYARERMLGEGGVGEVMLERDIDIDRVVAVKRLRAEATNETALLRFADEVRTIGQLEHPNIVPVHDVGIDEQGAHYFVMKYVEGETLEHVIEQLMNHVPAYVQRYTSERRADICLEIMRAIAYAHEQGVIHRDLKPANIMIGHHGEVMVMDWGIAKKVRKKNGQNSSAVPEFPTPSNTNVSTTEQDRIFQTQLGTLMGTPAYMSPEQAKGDTLNIDERTDVYSLSVLIHEFFTLQHYLTGKETLQTVLETIAGPDRPFTEYLNDVRHSGMAPEFIYFTMKGMKKNPSERYQSVNEMIDKFMQLRSGNIDVYCPCTFVKKGTLSINGSINSYPVATSVTVIVMTLLSIVGIVSLVRGFLH